MTTTTFPASVVPAGVSVTFTSDRQGVAVDSGAAYDFAIVAGEVRLWGARNRNPMRTDYKLALRTIILAAYRYATRSDDTGAQHDAHVQAGVASYAAFWDADAREADALGAKPTPAPKARRVVTRGLQSLALALSLASTLQAHAGAMLPFPASSAELHLAAREMPIGAATLRARVGAFIRGTHYEGRGEWNCAPKLCNALLLRHHVTWADVKAVWAGRTGFRSAVPFIAANDKGMRAP